MAYDERDAATADAIAKQIRAEWRSGEGTEASELRNRCWTLLVGAYGDLRAAAEFLFRKEPSMLSRFKSLCFAVQGSTAKPKPEAPEPPAE